MKKKKSVLIVIGIIIAVLIIWAAKWRSSRVPVEVAYATQGVLTVPLSADGVVEAITVQLAPEASGRLTELFVDEGDTVTMGQILAHITDEKAGAAVDEARAAYQAASARVKIASSQLDLARGQSQAAVAAASASLGLQRAQLDKAQTGARRQEIAQADAAVTAAKAQVQASEAALAAAVTGYQGAKEAAEAQMQSAQAQLTSAQAQLRKAERGARKQEIAQAEAAYDAAQAQSHNAKVHYQRIAELYNQSAMSKSALDDAETAKLAAKAEETAACEALDLLREGTRSEDIDIAKAAVAQAQSAVAQAETQQRMVQVRQKEVKAAEARLAQSKAALEESRQNANMLHEGTRPEDIVSQQQRVAIAEAQQSAALSSRAEVGAALQELKMATAEQERAAAVLQGARSHLSDTVVKSPINGVVGRKLAEAGDMIGPQTPILILRRMRVVALLALWYG